MYTTIAAWLPDTGGLTPHGFCLLWEPGLIWTYALSDIVTGVAYFSIPLTLALFARRRSDLVFRPLFLLFAAFIFLCGTTHFMDVATIWVPAYALGAGIKLATALASVVTAVALWWALPAALALPSRAQLEAANTALRESENRLHQSQKMEAVGQLTGGIAHDFNNLLQGLGGSLELIDRKLTRGQTDDIARHVAAARRAAASGAALIQQLMAFARKQALQPRPVDPDLLVRGMEELLRRSMGPSFHVAIRLRDGKWSALCDPHQLESALINLAINARDAMPDGGTLTIATADRQLGAADLADQPDISPGGYVEISVADTGTGMPPEVMGRVFEPFYTTKPAGKGTGLGLSQVYGFVKQSGGFVRLRSAVGQGTTVLIYLPRYSDVQPAATGSEAHTGDRPGGATSAGVVLVVEDEALVRQPIAEILSGAGYEVLEAEDGEAAIGLLQARAGIDLLVTDIGLPRLNGRHVADAALRLRPDMRVLFISGYPGAALDGVAFGRSIRFLRTPFAMDDFAQTVTALLDKAPPLPDQAAGPA